MNEATSSKIVATSAVAPSVAAILRNQHPNGAIVASPDFAEYQYCWLRDGSFIAHALDRAGEIGAAERFHHWSAAAIARIIPLITAALERHAAGEPVDASRMPPARFSLEGLAVDDAWPNFQIDGYGTWLWSLHRHLQMVDETTLPLGLRPAVEYSARYLAAMGTTPCYDVWEESGGYVHTSTLGCVHAGLSAAATMLDDPALEATAEALRRSLVDAASREGYFRKSDHNPDVDGSLLWLCEPFGVVSPRDQAFVETARRISAGLDLDGGIRRYPSDTYYGGGAWPVLTASLGSCYAAMGDVDAARQRLDWVAERIDDQGHLPEQVGGRDRDPDSYHEWVMRWGPPAADLVWSHAMYVVLASELGSGPDGLNVSTTTEPIGSP